MKKVLTPAGPDYGRGAILFPKGLYSVANLSPQLTMEQIFWNLLSLQELLLSYVAPERQGLLLIESSEIHCGGIPAYI